MRVYIIGAGPGDPKLITVRGAELVEACPVVLYTGSLVPKEVVARARPDAKVLDSSSMTLDEILAVLVEARDADANQIGPGRNLDIKRRAAIATEHAGDLVAGIGFADIALWIAASDAKTDRKSVV